MAAAAPRAPRPPAGFIRQQFDINGISMGGWMAAEFAVSHPERVRKLVLCCPAGLPTAYAGPPNLGTTLEDMYGFLVNDLEVIRNHLPKTPEEAARARADVSYSVFRFADALGNPDVFNAKTLPRTSSLFRKVTYEEGAVVQAGKRGFKRPRPFVLEPRIEPIVKKPTNDSYPSGHAMWSRVVGLLLADMLPEYGEQIMARADAVTDDRAGMAGARGWMPFRHAHMAGARARMAFRRASMTVARPGMAFPRVWNGIPRRRSGSRAGISVRKAQRSIEGDASACAVSEIRWRAPGEFVVGKRLGMADERGGMPFGCARMAGGGDGIPHGRARMAGGGDGMPRGRARVAGGGGGMPHGRARVAGGGGGMPHGRARVAGTRTGMTFQTVGNAMRAGTSGRYARA